MSKKVDNRTLSMEEKYKKQRQYNDLLESRNRKTEEKLANLASNIRSLTCKIEQLESDISEKHNKIKDLRHVLSEGGGCNCSDWQSCGIDPTTWDKLKKCNDCGKISVR